MRACSRALLALLLTAPVAAAADETPVGRVKTVSGTATILHRGESQPARAADAIYLGDVLTTGADGSLGLTLRDETRLAIGPDTRLTVDEFLFAPEENRGSFLARLTRGSLLYVSGLIAKLAPDAATVETPVGTIGIRGTRMLVKLVEEPG